jgi:hypothetical protein
MAASLVSLAKRQGNRGDAFSTVPVQMRHRLVERLDLLIRLKRTQSYGEQYDLLSERYTQDEGKEEFVKNSRRYYSNGDRFLGFAVKSVSAHFKSDGEANWWTFFGCMASREHGHRTHVRAAVDVVFEKGDFYFSDIEPATSLGGKAASYTH